MQWMHPAFIFSVLEVENENAAAWNEVPAAKKIPSCISCSLIIVFLRPVPPVVRPGGRTLIRSCILQLFFFLFPALDSCSLFLATKNLKAFILAHFRLFSPEIWKNCPALILR